MKKILALLFFGWVACQTVPACGPYERLYLARHYNTFRLGDGYEKGEYYNQEERVIRRIENCQAWARLTSKRIANSDIDEVVYRWDINTIQSLKKLVEQKSDYTGDNHFARWIVKHHDQEILDFLLLAKQCEQTRAQQFTAWYYPVKGDTFSQRLAGIVEQAKLYKGKRLADRYTLQALRALFASKQYEACTEYWNKHKKVFRKGIIRDMAVDYVAGSFIHLGENSKATQLYSENGQGYKAMKQQIGSRNERFNWMYRYNPDDPCLLTQMQQDIKNAENYEDRWNRLETDITSKYRPLYHRARKVCQERRCKDMSPWYYTMAFLSDKVGKSQQAYQYILKAEATARKADLADYIHILKIYLKTKTTNYYSDDFESYLLEELKWLDKNIKEHLDENTKNEIIERGAQCHICGLSQYYWNDMMRKIVISEVVPLCLRSNYQTRALQYLNMADNSIFNLVGNKHIISYPKRGDNDYNVVEKTLSWKVFRLTENQPDDYLKNEYDYQNDFFINLDSLGVKYVKRLQYRMAHPICELDSFLNARSYTDPQFFNDIIGTQLIASMRYAEAIPYLNNISERFNKSRNIYPSCKYDPFTMKVNQKPDAFYRLHFAQKMASLEKQMAICKDPNNKAELMLKYVAGIKNSTNNHCWALTSFYWGCWDCFPFFSQYQQGLKTKMEQQAEQMKREAFALFTDDERAAKSYYDWCMFKTAATRYPNTKTAKYIHGKCDVLRDYKK